jgi:CO dehydrogenase maturation factor
MTSIISITGKGGVGKTTFTSLVVRSIMEQGNEVVLAIDADPNSCLNECLDVDVEQTIGGLREDIQKERDDLPPGMSKQDYIDYQLKMAITEGEKFDMLTMGRQEGPGCYCYINNLLRTYIDNLSDKYNYVVIDNEAGMEHMSRRTTKSMDVLFIVSEPTKISIQTADRIIKLAKELELEFKKVVLIINRLPGELSESLQKLVDELGFENVELVPYDEQVMEFTGEQKPLLELPEGSKAVKAVREIVKRHVVG